MPNLRQHLAQLSPAARRALQEELARLDEGSEAKAGVQEAEAFLARARPRRRVVVTGVGAITPLGHSVKETWEGLVAGKSGIARITFFDASSYPAQIAGEVKGFDATKFIPMKAARRMSRATHLAVAATYEALADAGLATPFADEERVGVLIGTGIGGFDQVEQGVRTLWSKGWRSVGPFTLSNAIPNIMGHHVSQIFGTKGYLNTVVTACAAGTQAVGEAMEVIRRGQADVLIAGGAEAMVSEVGLAAFASIRALSQRNDEPEKAARPFEKNRDGFVISEGAGILILEELEHARARGAKIYCEVLGQASSSDAYHVAIPDPEGLGALRAMKWAVENAGLPLTAIDYINAHGPGTPVGDNIETLAIKKLFGERAYQIPVSSTKSMLGHSLGATGAIEAIACVMTLHHQVIHPTINYEVPDPECDLDYVPNVARSARVNVTLSNSFGLGGQNACLVLGEYEEP